MTSADIDEIATEIANIQDTINVNEKSIQDLEDLVEKKKKRFMEMDIEGKLKRRQGELDEAGKAIGELSKEQQTLIDEIKVDIDKCSKNADEN